MMMRLALLSIAACAATPVDAAKPADLRDYALAECLVKQAVSADLKTEGYRLGEIVIHRAGINPDSWKALDQAVDAELSRRPMMTTHVDAPVAQSDKPVPLAHCLGVIDAPRVMAAMVEIKSRAGRKR